MFLVMLAVLGCTQQQPDTAVPPTIGLSIEPTATAPAATPTPTPEPATAQPATATSVPATTQPPAPESTATPEAIQADLFLQLINPSETEVFVAEPVIEIAARTRVDAVVTINDTLVEPDIDGRFSLNVDLEVGPNIIEVVTSVASGEQEGLVLVVIYLP